ncbi:hypothetical protein WU85_02740 [Corynebacterium striatum]|nr:hypothetical protein WU85_02740 [Corynebacterium striatum]
MKKFSRFATAGLVFAAGLSLAACHPPNEQDSTSEKIDNASTYTGKAPKPAESTSSSEASESTAANNPAASESAAANPSVVVETQVVPAL